MTKAQAVVKNKAGIHVRPSGVIMQEIGPYSGTITLTAKGESLELNSIMSLLSLGLTEGDRVDISVQGPEEKEMCAKLVSLLETNYDFPKK